MTGPWHVRCATVVVLFQHLVESIWMRIQNRHGGITIVAGWDVCRVMVGR